jgi:hypothetical protein
MATGVFMTYGSFKFSPSDGYPIPQVSLSKEFDRDQAGRIIGGRTIVSLEGVIYNNIHDLDFQGFLTREKDLREAFSKDTFIKFGCGTNENTPSYSGNAKVNRLSIDKTENRWVSTIGYNADLIVEDVPTISQECTSTGIYNITSCQDEWNMEIIDEYSYVNSPVGANVLREALNFPLGSKYPIYRISRTIGAVGKFIPTGNNLGISAIAGAKKWVTCRLSTAPESSLTGMLSGIVLYNFVRSVAVDDPGGSYRLTDNWIGVPTGYSTSGLYIESFNIDSSLDSSYLRTVTINGTIKGLEPFDSGKIYDKSIIGTGLKGSISPMAQLVRSDSATSRFDQALSGYNSIKNSMFMRVQSFVEKQNNPSGIFRRFFGRDENTVNPLPLSVTEGFNPTEGSVTYSWIYNNRPLNLISGSISETLTINDSFPTQVVAELFVLGRRLGPVMQSLGTYTTASRDVTFDVVMPRPTGLAGIKFPKTAYIQITGLVESMNPMFLLGSSVCKSFVKNNTENWSVTDGRFTKQKTWVWQHCYQDITQNSNI